MVIELVCLGLIGLICLILIIGLVGLGLVVGLVGLAFFVDVGFLVLFWWTGGADIAAAVLAETSVHHGEGAKHERSHAGKDGGALGRDASLGEKDVKIAESEVDALDGLESAGEAGEDARVINSIEAFLSVSMTLAQTRNGFDG